MRYFLIVISVILINACTSQKIQPDIYSKIEVLQGRGEFEQTEKMIRDYLAANSGINEQEKEKLLFEIERCKRIENDYKLTEEALFTNLRNRLKDISKPEFESWQKEGRFDILFIDGEKRFANPSVSNLFFRFPELRERKINYSREDKTARLLWNHYQKLKSMAKNIADPVLFPRTGKVRQSILIKEDMVPQGQKVYCWLPYPVIFELQHNIQLLQSSHQPEWIAHPTSRIRSVYMEGAADDEGQAEFWIEYLYTAYSFYKVIDPQNVKPYDETDAVYKKYTMEEKPHKIFSAKMRAKVAEIISDENNPYLKGRLIYNWIADSIKYSYAREYSTLRNISEYCLSEMRGDCGQEGMLFLTMARIAGIPARWQSGFLMYPDDEGMHDWCEIYIKPYGWLPVDPYMGIYWTSITEDLTTDQRREMRDFYYGNIDHFRLVANKGHNQQLYPAKKHFRSETVDFQRGEVEWDEANLFFSAWRWNIDLEEVTRDDI